MSPESTKKSPEPLPKILLTGRSGQVGGDLYPLLAKVGEVLAPDRASLDLTRPERIRECVRAFRPDVIINAAAYTAVDKAESEPELAAAINSVAPGAFAEEAVRSGGVLIHYSTDYVFDGKKLEPYVESDPTNPLNVYGRTKAAGEQAIARSECDHLILRTSWVYSPRGSNFLLTILRLAREREELRIVDDQIGAPTASQSIAVATVQLLQQLLWQRSSKSPKSGIYHLTADGHCSWFDFATEIVDTAAIQGSKLQKLRSIPSSDYRTPAKRPLNSRLNCRKIFEQFTVKMPDWREGLLSVLDSLGILKTLPEGKRAPGT